MRAWENRNIVCRNLRKKPLLFLVGWIWFLMHVLKPFLRDDERGD